MNRIVPFLILLFWSTLGFSQEVGIVPQPDQVKLSKGFFHCAADIEYKLFGIEDDSLKVGIDQLRDEIKKDFNAGLSEGKAADIKIGIPKRDKDFNALCKKRSMFANNDLEEQGYELKITKDEILIAANTAQGIFYGIQSLKQLIRGAKENKLACLFIHDVPVLKYRGVMDDISRGPVPKKEFIKYQIRRLAELKINMFSFYIEHVVKTESHPEFAPANGGISIEEWKELSEYAKDYYVQLVGSFQSLGHFEHILSHPKYKHLGASNRMLFPGSRESLDFLSDIYSEMAPAFSSVFFNVNCDEAWDLGRGKTKALVDSLGLAKVYSDHINGLSSVLNENGKKMMMWGDIAIAHPEILQMIPKETIIMSWEYGDKDSFASFIDPFKENGFRFMVCPGVLNSNRLFPDIKSALNNNRKFIAEGVQNGAMGVLNTVWDDGGVHSFHRDWYGVAYGAEQAWNPGDRPIDGFNTNLSKGVYGDQSAVYFESIQQLMHLQEIRATQELNSAVFWNAMIPERGARIKFNMSDWDNVLEIVTKADSLLRLSDFKYYVDEIQFTQFVFDQYSYLAKGRINLLEASNTYAEACRIQYSNPDKAKDLLERSGELISECQNNYSALKSTLEYLWDQENRAYWKNYALDPYLKVISDYSDLQESFEDAVSLFKESQALPFPKDIRLDIEEQTNNYFLYWLLCGPFEIENETGSLPDFLTEMGGEQKAKPIPGYSLKGNGNRDYRWIKYSSPVINQIDLKNIYKPNSQVVAYAYCTIETDKDANVIASFGSNDGIEVYCNEKKLFSIRAKRDLDPDEDKCTLPLKAGKNHILLKIDNWKAGWAFSFRLQDKIVRNHKHKYKIVDDY